jgi:5-methyltetrahydrofolate--homocysteine methyltransferase
MSRFLEALHSGKVLLMDGAMGTELQRAGIQEGDCCELWNLTHPEKVRAIHQSYIDAGARCIVTNTFQANPFALARKGVQDKLEAIIEAGVEIARSVAGGDLFVLGSIGPIADNMCQATIFDYEQYQLARARVIRSLGEVDALLFETWSDAGIYILGEVRGELEEDLHRLPILGSFTYRRDRNAGGPCLKEGIRPERLARSIVTNPDCRLLSALGVNCGKDIGMDEILEVIRQYRQATDLPLFARPNAGTPKKEGGRFVYPHTPEQMAARLPELLEAGVSMVGGCCGTTPEHIAAFRKVVDDWNARH